MVSLMMININNDLNNSTHEQPYKLYATKYIFKHIKGKRGNFTSNIHIFLLKKENTYNKNLTSYLSCQESIRFNHVKILKTC